MEEIIEKYKKGKLTLYEFLHNGYLFVAGDKWTLDGGDRVVVKERALGVVNKPQSTDIHCYVHKSFALDKEIAAMEKQPEYEYPKIITENKEVWEILKEYAEDSCDWYDNTPSEGGLVVRNWFRVAERVAKGEVIYRRVEITPEQKREREVEELARFIKMKDTPNFGFSWDVLSESARNAYRRSALAAIEWMESKK